MCQYLSKDTIETRVGLVRSCDFIICANVLILIIAMATLEELSANLTPS